MNRSIAILGLACSLLLARPIFLQAEERIPLTLQEAVESALQNNLNLQLAKEETEIAIGAVQIAESRFDKNLSAQITSQEQEYTPLAEGYAENEETGNLGVDLSKRFAAGTEVKVGWANTRYDSDAAGLALNPSYGSTLNLDVSQPLLRGLGEQVQTAQITAAQKDSAAATYKVDSQAADLAALVKSSYWTLVFAWQDIDVKQLSLELAIKLLDETRAKISAGKLAQVEVYQPQSEVARREEDLIGAERAIGAAEDQLKLLMNSKDWLITYQPTDAPQTEPVTLDPLSVRENAIRNRPDLKAANLSIEAAKLNELVAEDNLRPQLNLVGGVSYGGTDGSYDDALSAAVDDSDTRWLLGVNFSYPLDNSYARGSLRQARATSNIAQKNSDLLKLEITRSVRTTVRDVDLAIKAMDATRKTSIATLKRLEAEQAKFEAGRSTTLDVLIAQEAYSQALSQENKSKILYAQSLAELDRIQGLVTY